MAPPLFLNRDIDLCGIGGCHVSDPKMVETAWMSTDTGVVTLLDALATKGILATQSPSSVFVDWSEIINLVEASSVDALENPGCQSCKPVTLSDTIIIPMAPRSHQDMPTIVALIGGLLRELIWRGLSRGTFFRGVVSAGTFYQADTKIFGPAIDEAAGWYEQAEWIGVSTTPAMSRLLDMYARGGVDVSAYFVPYDVPYKDGRSLHQWAINWPSYAMTISPDAETEILDAFFRHAGPVPPVVNAKYDNTLRFFREVNST